MLHVKFVRRVNFEVTLLRVELPWGLVVGTIPRGSALGRSFPLESNSRSTVVGALAWAQDSWVLQYLHCLYYLYNVKTCAFYRVAAQFVYVVD